jgi:hypothetical protein
MNNPDDLDRPLWGAAAIGRAAGITDRNGNVNIQAVYHACKMGYLDVTHVGRRLVTTVRRVRKSLGAEIQTQKAASG